MRILAGLSLAGCLVLGHTAGARGQAYYPGGVGYGHSYASPAPAALVFGYPRPRPYAFKDEPSMSINNSYLGYGNLVDEGSTAPAAGQGTPYDGPTLNRGYARPRSGFGWFGRRWGCPY